VRVSVFLDRLLVRLGLSTPSLAHVDVAMYTRRGCRLCDAAWQVLQEEQRSYGFALRAVDIDAEPHLAARFGEEVPVVVVNGQVRLWGRINRVLFRRLLRALPS
jgi:glutaredoxin